MQDHRGELAQQKKKKKRGIFVVFEGIDRSGKTTASHKVLEALRLAGKTCQRINFPWRDDSPTGKTIAAYLSKQKELSDQEIHDLFCKNRWEKKEYILKALEEFDFLLCDRYAYSGVAYSTAKGMDMEACKRGDEGLPAPDLVVYFDLSPEEAALRGGYGNEKYENIAFQTKVYEAFNKLGLGNPFQAFVAPFKPNRLVLEASFDPHFLHTRVANYLLGFSLAVDDGPVSTLW